MPKLPVISAKNLIKILNKLNFTTIHQRGSHIKLIRKINSSKEIIVIPNHKIIRKGTLKNILRILDLKIQEFISLLQ